MIDLRNFIEEVRDILKSHNLSTPGVYKRWLFQDAEGTRNMDADIYGCADAANILYTIGELPSGQNNNDRNDWISTLQSFQNEETGLYESEGMSPVHTTAFAAGALELFDTRPKHPIIGLSEFSKRENLIQLLESLDWVNNPWVSSHKGAGIYASMVLTGSVTLEWEDWYFDWLFHNADPDTGLWKNGCIYDGNHNLKGAPLFHHMASSFHYIFNCEYAKRPIPYAKQIIDTCIGMFQNNLYPVFNNTLTYNEIDFIYLLSHCVKRSGHRFEESQEIIRKIAEPFINYLLLLDNKTDDGINDLHNLFAAVSALAVIQDSVPGLLLTEKPLRLVLDRRPFL